MLYYPLKGNGSEMQQFWLSATEVKINMQCYTLHSKKLLIRGPACIKFLNNLDKKKPKKETHIGNFIYISNNFQLYLSS